MPPFLVDSHCHLDFPDFDADRDALMMRAAEAGVGLMVTISTFVSRIGRLIELTERYGNVYASVGTHPHNAGVEPEISADELIRRSAHPKIVAIGEAGLDYHYDNAPPEVQKAVFRQHIEAARSTRLPLIIHSRDADDDMAEILREETGRGSFPFILHCFSAGRALAETGIELGGHISLSGIFAFKRSEELRSIVADLPPERLLVETDAPYLAPPPHRGRRNEPAYVRHTAGVLAEVKNVSLEEIARITSDNFFALFSKVPDPRTSATPR